MKSESKPIRIKSINQLHQLMGKSSPVHPLISIINYGETSFNPTDFENGIILDFYKISFKTNFKGKLKYGMGHYDFEEGGMSFIAPGQILKMQDEEADYDGFSLHIHPDFLKHYTLNTNIKKFGYFSYSASEALYLSEKEKNTIISIFNFINDELNERIDNFSQDVIITQIELLLNYSNRFYSRQFNIRKAQNHDILIKVETILENYFNDENSIKRGLPTVNFIANEVNLSPRYLSDLFRNILGQNTQQFIHDKVIEKAKEYLTSGNLTVADVAFQLGFEHPQSFSKLFKNKTSVTPLTYKQTVS